jgi:DnaJ-class molecular chaperone
MGSTLKELEQEREKSEKFIVIKEAYEVLQNPESKRLYDAFIGNIKQ